MWELICCTFLFATFFLYMIRILQPTGRNQAVSSTLDAFIRTDAKVKSGSSKSKTRQQNRFTTDGRQILILYGTEYGFSEEIAFCLFDRLKHLSQHSNDQWQPRVLSVKHHKHVQWELENVCFLIMSTSGDGVPPSDAREFMANLMEKSLDLSHLSYSTLALGDSSYPHFCQTGRILDTRMKEMGGRAVISRMDVDGEDWNTINSWIDAAINWIGLQSAVESTVPKLDYLDVAGIEMSDSLNFNRHRPFMAILKSKILLTRVDDPLSDRETIMCEFDIAGSNLSWTSGDALGIYPANNPNTVTRILSLLQFSGEEMLPAPAHLYQQGTMPLKEILLKCYDIKRVTHVAYLSIKNLIAPQRANDVDHSSDELMKLQEYLASRELIDVLEGLISSSQRLLTIEELSSFLGTLRPLQPRFYSIASSPFVNSSTVTVIAAVVRYITHGRERGGVTTTYLEDQLTTGAECPVFISPNPDFRLPVDPNTSVILIGAGTGLAPYRAFLQERELANSIKKTFLYFGCRHEGWDYLCRQELEKWIREDVLCLRVAFSRQFPFKVYVQDLLKEDSLQIWQLLNEENAIVYVCGDARSMARDVDAALVSIVQNYNKCCISDAKNYLANLQKAGRYQRDVWIT